MVENKRVRPVLKCGPSRTKQSFRDECDINKIVSRIRENGFTPTTYSALRGAWYGDVSKMPDSFAGAQEVILRVKATFNSLPSEIRERFNNDPARFVAFVEMPSNRAEAVKMGLLAPEPAPAEKVESAPTSSDGGPTTEAPAGNPEGGA